MEFFVTFAQELSLSWNLTLGVHVQCSSAVCVQADTSRNRAGNGAGTRCAAWAMWPHACSWVRLAHAEGLSEEEAHWGCMGLQVVPR